MVVIQNGTVILPGQKNGVVTDLLVDGGKIIKIKEHAGMEAYLQEEKQKRGSDWRPECIDACGMIVSPGLVDIHVHFRDPGFTHKEDIETGARSAARGGITTVVLMANTNPPVDQTDTLTYILEKGKKTGIHIESCANVTMGMKGKTLTDMKALSEAGAAGFTDDGIPLRDPELILSAMKEAGRLGKPLSFHEEDPALIEQNGINAGAVAQKLGIGGSRREAEITMVERDLKLAAKEKADIVIQHISAKEAVDLVREAKKTNPRIHAEATPHHFTLTEEAVLRHGTLAKMNPPLREEEDRLAIIRGLQDGTIDVIATDHAPHSKEEKGKPLTEAPSGIIGLETALSLGIRELVQKNYLTLPELIRRMSETPAELYGLDAGKIREGAPADLVIFHPEETWEVKDYASRSENSPFTGQILPGVIYYTLCDGNIVYSRRSREQESRKGWLEMQKKKIKATVLSQTEIADEVYDMWIETDLAGDAGAGQFICVYPQNQSTLLPRPISICETDQAGGRIRIVYRVAGAGTTEFSHYHTGKGIWILGNLGNGFPVEEADGKKVLLMGGGIGIPPMVQLAKELKERGKAAQVAVAAGYRNGQLFLKEDLERYCAVYAATEDGSEGTAGNVLDAVAANGLEADLIYACGPMPMLRAIKAYAVKTGARAYLSLEERMACGVGACLGCVCKTIGKDSHSNVENARICTDGPVFLADDVDI